MTEVPSRAAEPGFIEGVLLPKTGLLIIIYPASQFKWPPPKAHQVSSMTGVRTLASRHRVQAFSHQILSHCSINKILRGKKSKGVSKISVSGLWGEDGLRVFEFLFCPFFSSIRPPRAGPADPCPCPRGSGSGI